MPPLAPGEARRLTRAPRPRPSNSSAVALVATALCCATLAACAAPDLHARAARDDAARETAVFSWVYDHDPARLDVWHLPVTTVEPYLRSGRARIATGDVIAACRAASREHALLLVVAPERSVVRTRALDCGVAVERDGFALVLAPR